LDEVGQTALQGEERNPYSWGSKNHQSLSWYKENDLRGNKVVQ